MSVSILDKEIHLKVIYALPNPF